MVPFPISMPGALRLRSLQPLMDWDGTCSLIYDVERAAVFEVPAELQLHIAPALETGDLDEALLGWLAGEDLLTAEGWGDWSGAEAETDCELGAMGTALGWDGGRDALRGAGPAGLTGPAAGFAAVPGIAWQAALPVRSAFCGAGNLGDEAHGWISQTCEGAALDALGTFFKRALGASRLKLHLDWAGTVPAGVLLDRVVAEARRRAAVSRQDLTFELAVDPGQIDSQVAGRLAALPLHVRLRCGECDAAALAGGPYENRPWLLAEPAVKLLLEAHVQEQLSLTPAAALLAPRPEPAPLTVQCVLHGPARLIELWRWAKGLGLGSLDVIRLDESDAVHPAADTVHSAPPAPPANPADPALPAVADASAASGIAAASGLSAQTLAAPALAGGAAAGQVPAAFGSELSELAELTARLASRARESRQYCEDLEAIYVETSSDLEAGRLPIDFQPLSQIVRRLMRRELPPALAGDLGAGQEAAGLAVPFAGIETLDPRQLPELWWLRLGDLTPAGGAGAGSALAAGSAGLAGSGTDGAGADSDTDSAAVPCAGCWARQVCSHSVYVASPLGSEDPRSPSREHCDIWCAEVEAALRLYHRLTQVDQTGAPLQQFLEADGGGAQPFHPLHSPQPLMPQGFAYLDLRSLKPS